MNSPHCTLLGSYSAPVPIHSRLSRLLVRSPSATRNRPYCKSRTVPVQDHLQLLLFNHQLPPEPLPNSREVPIQTRLQLLQFNYMQHPIQTDCNCSLSPPSTSGTRPSSKCKSRNVTIDSRSPPPKWRLFASALVPNPILSSRARRRSRFPRCQW